VAHGEAVARGESEFDALRHCEYVGLGEDEGEGEAQGDAEALRVGASDFVRAAEPEAHGEGDSVTLPVALEVGDDDLHRLKVADGQRVAEPLSAAVGESDAV
jgi:hypothetical protein